MSVDDDIRFALNLNNCLIEMYKVLIEEIDVKEVEEVFTNLKKRIEKDEKNLIRNASWLFDI